MGMAGSIDGGVRGRSAGSILDWLRKLRCTEHSHFGGPAALTPFGGGGLSARGLWSEHIHVGGPAALTPFGGGETATFQR